MIRLDKPLKLNEYISAIQLASEDEEFPAGTKLVTAGFGRNESYGSQTFPEELQVNKSW